MRYYCYTCGKSVTSELPSDSVIRAILVCPECIGDNKVVVSKNIKTLSELSNKKIKQQKDYL